MADLTEARAAKARLRTDLAGRRGIRGIGLSRTATGYGVRVNVARLGDVDVPRAVDGVPVEVRVVGRVNAGG